MTGTRIALIRPSLVLALSAMLSAPALGVNVVTYAGIGTPGFTGDGGPGFAAQLFTPSDIALDINGGLFIADTSNHAIRRVSVLGVITTIAGMPGLDGVSGNNGPATAAHVGTPSDLSLDPAGNLYVTQPNFHVVRAIDPAGTIAAFAGTGAFGFSGDGGAATTAALGTPSGTVVDPITNNVLIADTFNGRIRSVDAATGTINTIAGNGFPFISGDGGLASVAGLGQVRKLAMNDNGDLFLFGLSATGTLLRKIDATTGIITTVAGGGVSTADSGPATSIDLGQLFSIHADGNDILLGGNGRMWRLDTDTEILTAIAGTGVPGFGGNNGDPLAAQFGPISGMAIDGLGGIYIADSQNHSIRYIQPDLTDLFVTVNTSQAVLDAATTLPGSVVVDGLEIRVEVTIPNLETVGGDVTVTDNADLETLDLPMLETVGGDLTVVGNEASIVVELPELESVDGDITIVDNGSSNTVDVSSLVTAGGDITIVDNGSSNTVDVSSLVTAGGDIMIVDNGSSNTVDVSSLVTAGGDIVIVDNGESNIVDISSLVTFGGDITIADNGESNFVDISSLVTVEGDITIADNGESNIVDISSLVTVGGDVTVTDNADLETLDLPMLETVGGDVSIVDNDTVTAVEFPSLETVGGDVSIVDNDTVTAVEFPSFETASGDVSIVNNNTVTTVEFPSLETAGGDVSIIDNDTVTAVEFPSLETASGDVSIVNNDTATAVQFPSLETVGGDVTVDDNDAAPIVVLNTAVVLTIGGDANLGDGTFDLVAPVDIGGQLNVRDGGRVKVNAELTAALINVDQGGNLGGDGEIDAPVENDGTVAPGNSPGKLTTGPFTQTAGGVLQIEIAGHEAETEYDVLHAMGDVVLAGTVQFEFLGDFDPMPGDEFAFLIGEGSLDFSAASFTFVGAPTDARFNVALAGNALTLTAVPEPSTLAMCLLGVGIALLRARRGVAFRRGNGPR